LQEFSQIWRNTYDKCERSLSDQFFKCASECRVLFIERDETTSVAKAGWHLNSR